jgi:hypothetical protein
MKIKIQNKPENVELIKAMVSRDTVKAHEAQEAFAALIEPTIEKILLQADTTQGLFERFEYNEGDDPSIPLALYRNMKQNNFSVWANEVAGGLARNHIYEPTEELKFKTYKLDSAWSADQKFIKKARLDVVSQGLTMMAQEILLKQNRNAWNTIMAALANASHDVNGTATSHVFRGVTAGVFNLDVLNDLFTRIRRLNMSWVSGTPTEQKGKVTDLYFSPEVMAKVRKMGYNPVNTMGANNVAGTQYSGVIAMPDSVRAQAFNAAGVASFIGVNLVEMNELGVGYLYNTIFDNYAASTQYTDADGTNGAVFDGATEQIIVGVDATIPGLYQPVEVSDPEDKPSTFVLRPDDQYLTRSSQVGEYGSIQVGHVSLDSRKLSGIIL